jgi:ribonuclease T1
MKQLSLGTLKVLVAGALLAVGLVGVHTGLGNAAVVAHARCGDTSHYRHVALSRLPPQAGQTVNLIKDRGPFPYRQDGEVFANRSDTLPQCARGYYHEYTVPTPGVGGRGAHRFVVGRRGEFFYTADHYQSFELTNIHA